MYNWNWKWYRGKNYSSNEEKVELRIEPIAKNYFTTESEESEKNNHHEKKMKLHKVKN